MFDPKLYHEACSEMHVSEEKLQEVIHMTEQNKKRAVRRPLRVGLAAAALCALTVVGASAANPEFLEGIVLSIRSTVVVSDYQEELIMEDGSQITALHFPDVSVEERDGRTILIVNGAETDITGALSEDGRYVWEDTDNGSQAQVIVTLDEDGKPVWVANVAAAGETFEEAGVSVVSEPADGRPDSSAD